MIKTIIFDLGNVIVSVNYEKMLRGFQFNGKNSLQFIENYYKNSTVRKSFEKGKINSQQLYNTFCEDLGLNMSLSDFKETWCKIFSLNKNVSYLIRKLKKQYQLILLSNTDELHFDYIKNKYKIIDEFDKLILSYEVGYRKPNPIIFLKALKEAKTMPFNCIYIDDIKDFVFVARLIGIKAFQYKNYHKLADDLRKVGILHKIYK